MLFRKFVSGLVFSFLVCIHPGYSQSIYTIKGKITDAENNAFLAGVTLYENESGKGTHSNNSGNYSLSLPEGNYQISCSFVGYKTVKKWIILNKNLTQITGMSTNEVLCNY